MAESPPSHPHLDILPEERAPASNGGQLAWFILIPILLVIATNFAVAELLARVPVNGGYALANRKWSMLEAAIKEKRKLDVLIVGDSSANQGLDPAIFTARTGQTAMNFAVVADALPIESVWTVREWCEKSKSPPRAVYWMHVSDIWSRQDNGHRRLLAITSAMPPSVLKQVEKGPRVRFTTDEAKWRRRTPLWSQSTSMQLLVRRPLDSWAASRRFIPDANGFTAEHEADVSLVDRDTRIHKMIARDDDWWRPTRTGRDSLRTMAKLAKQYGFHLYLVEAPINRTLWEDEPFRQRWMTVHQSLVEFARSVPHVTVVFDRPMTFADERMQNCDHVLSDAATEFTTAVIDRVMHQTTATDKQRPKPTTKRSKKRAAR